MSNCNECCKDLTFGCYIRRGLERMRKDWGFMTGDSKDKTIMLSSAYKNISSPECMLYYLEREGVKIPDCMQEDDWVKRTLVGVYDMGRIVSLLVSIDMIPLLREEKEILLSKLGLDESFIQFFDDVWCLCSHSVKIRDLLSDCRYDGVWTGNN